MEKFRVILKATPNGLKYSINLFDTFNAAYNQAKRDERRRWYWMIRRETDKVVLAQRKEPQS